VYAVNSYILGGTRGLTPDALRAWASRGDRGMDGRSPMNGNGAPVGAPFRVTVVPPYRRGLSAGYGASGIDAQTRRGQGLPVTAAGALHDDVRANLDGRLADRASAVVPSIVLGGARE